MRLASWKKPGPQKSISVGIISKQSGNFKKSTHWAHHSDSNLSYAQSAYDGYGSGLDSHFTLGYNLRY
jgi:hypothetical protein